MLETETRSKNGQKKKKIPEQFLENFFPGSFLSIQLCPRKIYYFRLNGSPSEIQQFPGFLETFRGNFCTIYHRFQIVESFG